MTARLRHQPRSGATQWQEDAACRGMDTEMFYLPDRMRGPMARQHERRALNVCAQCPVITECRQWALSVDDNWAVLGGLTPDQRNELRRHRQVG